MLIHQMSAADPVGIDFGIGGPCVGWAGTAVLCFTAVGWRMVWHSWVVRGTFRTNMP